MLKTLLGFFMPGSLGAIAIVIGVVALVSASSASLITARYYNNLIVSSSTHAAQVSYDLGVKNQKAADAAMSVAREADGRARGAREQADADRKAIADAWLNAHKPADIAACRLPKEFAKDINKAVGVHP